MAQGNKYDSIVDSMINEESSNAASRGPAVVPGSMQVEPAGRGPAVVQDADFMNAMNEERDSQKQKIRASMYAGTKTDPDRYAKVLEISKKTKLPADTVDRNLDTISKEIRVKTDYDDLIDKSPGLAKWLEKPDNAAIGQDDIDNLKRTESAMQQRGFGGEIVDSIKYGFYRRISGTIKAGAFAEAENRGAFTDLEKQLGLDLTPKVATKDIVDNAMTRYLDREAERFAPPDINASVVDELMSGNFKRFGRSISFQIASNIPNIAILAASRGAGLAVLGTQVAGEKLATNIDKDIPESTAKINAILTGGLEAGIESLGGIGANPLKKVVKDLSDRVGRRTAIEAVSEGFKHILGSTKVESLEEGATTLGEAAVDWAMGVNPGAFENIVKDTINSMIVGGASGGVYGGAAASPAIAMKLFARNQTSTSSRDSYLEVGSAAKESKVKGRSAGVHAGFLDAIASDQNMRDVYIPVDAVDAYFQSANENITKVMQDLGAVEAYAQAKETGADVKIPFSTFVDKLSTTPHYEALQNDIKFDPADRTVNELKVEQEVVQAQVEEQANAAAAEPVVDQAAVSGKAVVENVAAQLKEIKADPKQAALYRGFEVLGRRVGVDPLELFNRYQTKISRGDTESAVDFFDRLIEENKRQAGLPEVERAATLSETGAEAKAEIKHMARLALQELPDVSTDAVAEAFGLSKNETRFLAKGMKRKGKKATGGYSSQEIIDAAKGAFVKFSQSAAPVTIDGGITYTPNGRLDPARSIIERRFAEILSAPDAPEAYSKLEQTFGGKLLDTDAARFLLPEFAASREGAMIHTQTSHMPAGEFIWNQYVERLKNEPKSHVILTVGGGGAGKSTVLNGLLADDMESAEIAYDGTGKNLEEQRDKIQMALDSGRAVQMAMIYTDVVESAKRALIRFERSGRTIPAESFIETHVKSVNNFLTLAEEFKGDERVEFLVFDNTGKTKEISLEDLDKLRYNVDGESEAEAIRRLLPPVKEYLDVAEKEVAEATARWKARSQPGIDGEVPGVEQNNRESDPESATGSTREESGQESKDRLKQGDRGQILFDRRTGAVRIELLKNADASTFIHETGHLYMRVLSDLSKDISAITTESRTPEQAGVLNDVESVLKWMGADSIESITVDQQEKFARGFEAYLMEGKAPSSALRKAFARFKVWLVSVYRSMSGLNVELSEDIRGVMDRILATDAEIAEVYREQNFEPIFKNAEEAGMTRDQFENYIDAREEAKQSASEALTSKVLKEFERERQAWYKTTKAKLKADLIEQISQEPVYQAIAKLSGGLTMPDGKPMKLSRAALEADFSDKLVKKLPASILDSRFGIEGIHPAIASEILGFQNADDMVTRIANAPKIEDAAATAAEIQMKERYPELINEGPVFNDEAVKQAHSDKRAQVLRMELEHMASNNMPALKTAIKRIAARVPSEKAVRDQAKITIGKMKYGDIKPHLYLRAESKAAKEAGEFLAKGDFEKAFESKRKELLSHELYRAAVEAQDQFDKYVAKFKPIMRPDADLAKTRDVDLINAARAVLAQYGIGKTDKPADAYLEQMRRYDPDTYSVMAALVESATQNADHYKEVAFDDFVAMGDAVVAMWDLSKSVMEIEIDGKAVSRAEALEQLSAQINTFQDPAAEKEYEKTADTWDKVKVGLLGARAALTRAEAWANAMDVGKPDGPFTKYIWNPVSQGTLRYRSEKTKVINQFKDIVQEWGKSQTRAAIPAQELGFTFKDKTELMMSVLHSGNTSNLDKLLRGRGWANPTLDGSLDTTSWDVFLARMFREGILTKQDYDFAQKVWDLNESLKPVAQIAHKKMYGHYFSEITAQEIQTPFGTYRGGYVPAKVDIYTNEDASIRRERELFEKNNNSYQFPTTGRGFTKSRVQQYAAPLSLDMNLLGGHLDGVLRFAYIEPHVKQVARIVQNTGFRQRLADVDQTVGRELLTPWLQRAAQQRVVTPADNGIGKLTDATARFLRRSVAMQIMFGNITNTMQQITGVVVAAAKIEPKYLRSAVADYLRDIKGTQAAITEKSEWMRVNQDQSIYDAQQAIDKILVDPTVFENAKDFATRHTYVFQTFTQNIVNSVVWTAAYNKAVESGLNESLAVKQADSAVRLTQGTSAPEDVSRFETGTATSRLFTQFAGYFNMLFNLGQTEIQKISREVGLRNGAGRMFYVYLTAFMIPAVLSEAIVRVMAGTLDEDDDEEYLDDMLTGFFGSQFRTATAMIPYGGQFLNAGLNRFNDKPFDDRVSMSPVVSTLESMVGVPSEVYKAISGDMPNKRKVTKDALMFIGVASSLPVGPLGKPAGYLLDVESGRARPSGPIDFTRGLVTGRAGR